MIELIFVACLKLAADACEERSKVHTAEIGIMGCMVTAQAELAAWTECASRVRGGALVLPLGGQRRARRLTSALAPAALPACRFERI